MVYKLFVPYKVGFQPPRVMCSITNPYITFSCELQTHDSCFEWFINKISSSSHMEYCSNICNQFIMASHLHEYRFCGLCENFKLGLNLDLVWENINPKVTIPFSKWQAINLTKRFPRVLKILRKCQMLLCRSF